MKKIILFAVPLLFGLQTSAQGNYDLCRREYSWSEFKSWLHLAVTPPQQGQKNPVLWMDTHIPYGIRPIGYEITDIECDIHSVRIAASSNTDMDNVEFKFEKIQGDTVQTGFLIYLDKQGHEVGRSQLECSASAIQNLCNDYAIKILQ